MNGRSDASTSTDDVKSRPLCLFYFTHPFGVLSPEPPTVAPPHVARAFLNMQPVAPFAPFDLWTPSSDPEYDTASSASSRPAYELGKVTLHRSPVTLRPPDLPRPPRADSIASSLFSSDIWFNSSSSSRTNEYSRRVIPYNRILPPLQLPRTITDLDDSDEYWPKKCLNPEKFSLPPIELPALREETVTVSVEELSPASETRRGREAREGRWLRREGVLKPRRRRRLDARRMLACLMRRAVRGGRECNPSPALREVLHVIRAAWAEPASLYDRFHYQQPPAVWRGAEGRAGGDAMLPRDASPGLLRRRYSVPETIMRRYKVSQQKTECEGSVAGSAGSASAGSGAGGRGRGAPSHAPHTRDRELMRRSALLRRMWGRAPAASSPTPASPPTSPPAAACCRCCCDHVRPSRSLDGSRADLRPRLSASTYRSHAARGLSSCLDTDTDRPPSLYDEPTSEAVTVEIESASELPPAFERSALSERVPRISSSSSTSHQSTSAEQDTEVHPTTPPSDDHSTLSVPNENHLLLTTNPIVAVETPSSCEMLEIVVTQTSEPGVIPAPRLLAPLTAPHHGSHAAVRLDIDRYVSDVLVESLNSLSDRLEYVTSSVEGDGKISVIEKEIKVKLHSTGVNTIVHLSPTSNNQIIFGNEELCDGDERDQSNNNPRGSLSIRDEPPRDDARNNNQPATPSPCPSPTPSPAPAPLLAPALMRHRGHVFEQLLQHDNVNKAVLQQIQKLFDEELQSLNNEQNHPNNVTSGISHIEISNVDVFLHENESSVVEMTAADTRDARSGVEVEELSGVGAGSYFETSEGVVVVPRFSALPHTDSMEVNTSSSEDADGIASECTSLVDSLDDPNSPRSVLIRRNFNNRKTELVRSAIDVLDLLPENTMPCDSRDDVHKDKPESFFITIKDNECECDKENFNVADRMPEKIKERLIRRHRRRQQRMECARRSRGTQHRDELYRTKREVERDCVAIINSLIDEVIAKIAKDEFKCARIKRKSDRLAPSKSDENYSRKNRKKNLRPSDGPPNIATKPSIEKLPAGGDHQQVEEKHQVRGKLSLMTRPPLNLTEAAPRRVYQKSEILEGNKCIEILEILEYVNGTQSSPGTPVSDDSPGTAAGRSGKRSRIPVPVTERSQRPQPPPLRYLSNSADNSPGSPPEPPSENTSVREKRRASEGDLFTGGVSPSSRRVLYPASVDTRPRSDSLRFRRVFDMIPEERSSVSVESSDVERAAPARTRSVATSPLPVAAAPPLRVKGGDMPRRARVWAPLGRREEGITCTPLLLPHRIASPLSVD